MLDASTRIDVLNLLGDLKARGLGVLFITHDLSLGQLHQRQDDDPSQGRDRRAGPDRERAGQSPARVHEDASGLGPAAAHEMER